MKIPFRDSIFSNSGRETGKIIRSNLTYLELYLAVHDCKNLIEEQVLELQGLLSEKLKDRRESHKSRSRELTKRI